MAETLEDLKFRVSQAERRGKQDVLASSKLQERLQEAAGRAAKAEAAAEEAWHAATAHEAHARDAEGRCADAEATARAAETRCQVRCTCGPFCGGHILAREERCRRLRTAHDSCTALPQLTCVSAQQVDACAQCMGGPCAFGNCHQALATGRLAGVHARGRGAGMRNSLDTCQSMCLQPVYASGGWCDRPRR